MTSSRRRRRARAPVWRRLAVVLAAFAVFAGVLYTCWHLLPARRDADAAAAHVQQSIALLAASNPTAARAQALDAVRADPNAPEAHMALAHALLALGDGIGGEAAIHRAVDAGFDAARVHGLLAEALLQQGDADRALAEADKASGADRAYGLRIRARALTAAGDYAGARDALAEAQRIAPRDVRLWVDIGRFRFGAGDMAGAIEAGAQALALGKGNIDALVLRGQLVRAQYGLVAALPWFEAALRRDPWYHDALIEYAATLGDVGRTRDMLAVTRRALAARPGSPQAFYLQAVLAARAGNYDLSRSLLQRTGGTLDDVPGVLLLGGVLDLQSGGYEQAIEKLRELVGRQPMNITARKLLAVALLRTDAARNALDVLRPVVLRPDADSYALALAARGFERIGDRANAARFLDRAALPVRADSTSFSADDGKDVAAGAAADAPFDPEAVLPMIRALIDSGDKAGALARAQALERANPGAADAHVIVGDMLMLGGRAAAAVAAYQQAANLRFDEPVMLRLVEAQEDAGRRQDAANTLALFLSQNPANVAALRLSAHWQLAAGDYDAAVATLERLRDRLGDGDAALDAELALAYAGAGDGDAAQGFGEAAYARAPANAAAADAYGWALFQAGEDARAVALLEKAVRLAPGHAVLRWHLAQAYAESNRPVEARAEAQAALKDSGFTDRAAALALVARLG